MAEEGTAAGMEIDTVPTPAATNNNTTEASGEKKAKPRFEIKKYNAVALWAWGRVFISNLSVPSLCFMFLVHVSDIFRLY